MLTLSKSHIHSFEGDVLSIEVKEFTGPLQLSIDHPELVRLKELGPGKYLVVLDQVGDAVITFCSGDESARCPVSVREALVSDPDGSFDIYVGDLHSHTSYSDGQLTPYEVYDKVKKERYFDFFTISDHGSWRTMMSSSTPLMPQICTSQRILPPLQGVNPSWIC